jgi:hypothetical protein
MQQWGSNPTLYAPVDFWKKFMDRPYVYFFFFFIFFFRNFNENVPIPDQFLFI